MATRHESINEGFAREDFGWDLPAGVKELSPEKLAAAKAQRAADNAAGYTAGLEKAQAMAARIIRHLDSMRLVPASDFAKQLDYHDVGFMTDFAARLETALAHLDNL